ncbi:MAG TPA: 30S ribosomal protein S2, partial [Chitinophagales bacterium]|nr:30S ribosomal protein S2 [Chitinophagales bacterium]
ISHEDIALKEAQRLNINTVSIVDTSSDPIKVDFAIPANDDAAQSIAIITNFIVDAIAEGLAERALNKDEENDVEVDDEKNHFDEIKEEESGEDGKGRRRRSGGSGHGGGAGTGGAGKSRSRSGGGAGPRK